MILNPKAGMAAQATALQETTARCQHVALRRWLWALSGACYVSMQYTRNRLTVLSISLLQKGKHCTELVLAVV